jgi:hypothetical protein
MRLEKPAQDLLRKGQVLGRTMLCKAQKKEHWHQTRSFLRSKNSAQKLPA